MDFLENLDNNSILIIPSNIKDKILNFLENNSILKSIKIMSFNDLKKGLLFDYNNETIYYVMKNYHVSYSVALNYINNLYYIEDKLYEEDKLIFLKDMYDKLDSEKLLIHDRLFISLLKSKTKIYIFGFDYISLFNKYLLDKIEYYIKIEYIDKKTNTYQHPIYKIDTLENEVLFVAEKIAELINKGIDINKIYLANYTNDYYFWISTIFNDYGIPYYLKNETTLYQTAIGSYFLNHLEDNLDSILYKIRKIFNIDNNEDNARVYEKLANFCNNYYWTKTPSKLEKLIEEEMKCVKIPIMHHDKEVKTVSLTDNYYLDDEYVFLLGFNLGVIPVIKKDEDYINDAIKPSFLEKTEVINKLEKERIINSIQSIKNITISYKCSSSFDTYEASILVNNFEVININNFISNYSNNNNKLLLAKKIDKLIKFNEYSDDLSLLNNSYSIPYNTYDNSFTGINNSELIDNILNRVSFSYSNISTYYKCPFMFYVDNILNVNIFEERLDQLIGNLFHYCLEKCVKTDDDVIETYNEYIDKYKEKMHLTNKDKFFLNILKDEISFVVDTIKKQYSHSMHNDEKLEKKIKKEIKRKIKVTLKGNVDKILFFDNYAIIIDYKTNDKSIDKDLFKFGVDIQLPIYLYLLKLEDENIEVVGMYLQHILNKNIKYDKNTTVEERKEKSLKLDGITLDNIDIISKYDDTLEKSKIIEGISITKSGTFKKSKRIISEEDRKNLTDLIENLINSCIDNVLDGDFKINPLIIDKKVNGCQYCDYKDICYRKPKDFNYQIITKEGDAEDE